MWAGPWLVGRVREAGASRSQALCLSAWAVGLGVYAATRRRGPRSRLVAMLAGLGAAGVLALLLSAVQVLPVLDHITASVRWAGGGPEDLYDSSLLPYRAFEWIWPNVSGTFTAGNRYWITILPPTGAHWPSPLSLYAGALPIVLAMGAAGFRGGPPWRAWMTAVALLSFWASLGAFAGPASWSAARPSPEAGDDSFYGLLTIVLPALRLFRFPFKLLPFTAVGLSALAGLGWDRVSSGVGRRRTLTVAVVLLLPTLLCLAAAAGMRSARWPPRSPAGPPATLSSGRSTRPGGRRDRAGTGPRGRCPGLGPGRPGLVGRSSPGRCGRDRDGPHRGRPRRGQRALWCSPFPRRISSASPKPSAPSARRNATTPARVRSGSIGCPPGSRLAGPDPGRARLRELVDWEIDTLQPSFGWLHGLHYVFVDESEIARDDQRRLFRPASRVLDAGLSAALEIEPDRRVLYHARGAFDLWVRRDFIIPSHPGNWTRANAAPPRLSMRPT